VHTAAATAGVAGISGAVLFLAVVATVILWCVPLIIAALYNLPRKGPIAVLSLALGWTGVAWLAALVIVVGWCHPGGGAAAGRAMARAHVEAAPGSSLLATRPPPQNPQYEHSQPPYGGPPPRRPTLALGSDRCRAHPQPVRRELQRQSPAAALLVTRGGLIQRRPDRIPGRSSSAQDVWPTLPAKSSRDSAVGNPLLR